MVKNQFAHVLSVDMNKMDNTFLFYHAPMRDPLESPADAPSPPLWQCASRPDDRLDHVTRQTITNHRELLVEQNALQDKRAWMLTC